MTASENNASSILSAGGLLSTLSETWWLSTKSAPKKGKRHAGGTSNVGRRLETLHTLKLINIVNRATVAWSWIGSVVIEICNIMTLWMRCHRHWEQYIRRRFSSYDQQQLDRAGWATSQVRCARTWSALFATSSPSQPNGTPKYPISSSPKWS